MRLLVAVLAVLVGGSVAQKQTYYARAPLRPIAPYRYSERVVSQGRIATGSSPGFIRDDDDDYYTPSSSNPCQPTPCGPYTRCDVNENGIALCRCLDGYVPISNTIEGCKTQCDQNNDCPNDYRCSANKCVRVCTTGACGYNAECTARNHIAHCECPRNSRGDAQVRCVQEEKEDRVAPPAPYVSPCERDPCGANTDCNVKVDRAVCSCRFGYQGNPLTGCRKSECTENRDCRSNQVCQGLKCIDPCSSSPCGINTNCNTINHQPVCSCLDGYTGKPLERCFPYEPCHPTPCGDNTHCKEENGRAVCSCYDTYIGDPLTGCRPECVSDGECPTDMRCRANLCEHPCRDGACGEGAYCDVKNRQAVCTCPQYFKGNARSRCYPECTEHDHCGPTNACYKFECVDPCVGACGTNAICKVENHKPICSCPKDRTGHPFTNCRLFELSDLCEPNPCGTLADCTPGKDRSNEDRPVCSCPMGYIGNPLLACQRGECTENHQCPKNKACYGYECKTPCYTLDGDSVCGDNAYCKVVDHMPVCYCPENYGGDARNGCYIDNRRSSGSYAIGRN